jgi:thiaminase/transcriptional activator TenA
MAASIANRAYVPADSLVGRLIAGTDWPAYVEHAFVRQLGQGSLPEACFRHYLGQDYLFLIHFARAYALAVYKSDSLAEMRHAAGMVKALLDVEMGMHVEFCAGWGLGEAEMAALPEATATMAYTRYVLERGQSGDILDLYAALAPCVVGYGEIGARLGAEPAALARNPYRPWIEMYASPEYQQLVTAAVAQLDRLGRTRMTDARFPALAKTFDQATRLEVGFWRMGLGLES